MHQHAGQAVIVLVTQDCWFLRRTGLPRLLSDGYHCSGDPSQKRLLLWTIEESIQLGQEELLGVSHYGSPNY